MHFAYLVDVGFDIRDLIIWTLVGIVAGFLASRTMFGKGMGVVLDAVVGIAGAVTGGLIAQALGVQITIAGAGGLTSLYLDRIMIAFVGAILVLLVVRVIGNTRSA